MGSSHKGTCFRDLRQGEVYRTCPYVCALTTVLSFVTAHTFCASWLRFWHRIKKSGSTFETVALFYLISFGHRGENPLVWKQCLPKLQISDICSRGKFESSASTEVRNIFPGGRFRGIIHRLKRVALGWVVGDVCVRLAKRANSSRGCFF